jgi:amidase
VWSMSVTLTLVISIPAAFNGLFGLKPSTGRLPYAGMANSMPGQETVRSACGPLASSARDLRLLTRSVLSQEPWLHDPLVVEMPWRDELSSLPAKMVFGVYRSDPDDTASWFSARPLAPVNRAMDIVTAMIRKLGHDVIEWEPPSHGMILSVAVSPLIRS